MLASAAVSLLGACSGPLPDEQRAAQQAKLAALEDPPPKPPHCRTPDGALQGAEAAADELRVVSVAGTLLYIPKGWVAGYFVDAAKGRDGGGPPSYEILLGKFEPDLHAEECPGVVHDFRTGVRANRYGGFGIVVPGGASRLPSDGVEIVILPWKQPPSEAQPGARMESSGDEFARRGWRRLGEAFAFEDASAPAGLRTVREGNPPSELIALQPVGPQLGLGLLFPKSAAGPGQWRGLFERGVALFRWLATPPARRTVKPPAIGFDLEESG